MDRRRLLTLSAGLFAPPQLSWASPAIAPLRRLRLINFHTGETFDGPFRDDLGPIALALADLSELLRDHHSGEKSPIDVGVLDFLAGVMDAVGATRATVLSAYRTPETNARLARTQFGVADNSQHIYGRALDIQLDARNERAVQAARAMQRGGVGWYPRSRFFHIDSGPVRNWTLDDRGLDTLLDKLRHDLLSARHQKQLVLPGFEQSGDPLPNLANSGQPLPVLEQSGRRLTGFELDRPRLGSRGGHSVSVGVRGARF